jgi:hypothetical protein
MTKQELSASLGERQVAKFIHDEEIKAREIIGETSRTTSPRFFFFEPVGRIDGVEETAARPGTDASARDRHRHVSCRCPPL